MTSYSESSNYEKIVKIYNHKLKKLQSAYQLELLYSKFWELVPKNHLNQISKESFNLLFSKVYRVILPVYNYSKLSNFLENEWTSYAKE